MASALFSCVGFLYQDIINDKLQDSGNPGDCEPFRLRKKRFGSDRQPFSGGKEPDDTRFHIGGGTGCGCHSGRAGSHGSILFAGCAEPIDRDPTHEWLALDELQWNFERHRIPFAGANELRHRNHQEYRA